MRLWLPLAGLVALVGCASGNPNAPPAPAAAPAWEPAVQVADVGPGYAISRGPVVHGGPSHLVVDPAGHAFVAVLHAASLDIFLPSVQGWLNVYEPASGWRSPVLLAEGVGLANDACNGIGLTPDGAQFGWSEVAMFDNTSGLHGLRGFDVRTGWVPAGTLLKVPARRGDVARMATTRDGTPTLAYQQGDDVFAVRYIGGLEGPQRILTADGLGQVAVDGLDDFAAVGLSGNVALRLADGRWSTIPGGHPGSMTLMGRPEGGFQAVWTDATETMVTYTAARLDVPGGWSSPEVLGSVNQAACHPTSIFFCAYDPGPQLAVGPSGSAAVAWLDHDAVIVTTRLKGGSWGARQAIPNTTATASSGFLAAAMDARDTLLVLWFQEGLCSAQQAPGQVWSPRSLVTSRAESGSLLLAMNASGTAFATWRDGERVMAARSPAR